METNNKRGYRLCNKTGDVGVKAEVIKMPYIKNLSVNHYLGRRAGGGYYVRPEVRKWKDDFGWLLKRLHLEEWGLPLQITCDGVFKNERSAPDLSNLSKVICDTIQSVCGVNDKNYRWHDGEREIGGEPHLMITIRESESCKE